MANFKTHLQFATVGSGLASTLFLSAQVLTPVEAFLCWIMGTLGGILPDIDSDNSYSLSILFAVISVTACFLTAVSWIPHWPLLWVWAACALVFVIVQYGVRTVFEKFTVHRGIFHSLIAGLFFMFFVAAAAGRLGAGDTTSWFLGTFTGFGYFLHLALDEIFSVDLMNARVKRSFGTAIKIWDPRNMVTSVMMAAGAVAVFMVAPPPYAFLDVLTDPGTYAVVFIGFRSLAG